MPALKVGLFGDAGNALTNGSSFYYAPGYYQIYDTGASGPLQQAVNRMMRSWGVSELIQLGDAAYNTNSSTLLDYNIGQFYNDFQAPYGNTPSSFSFADPKSIYSLKGQGGVQAVAGKKQWPYNLYDFPNGFPNPSTGGTGGSADGLNHFWLISGNHDEATVIGSYSDTNVTQLNFDKKYINPPGGPDAYDYANNIKDTPIPPANDPAFTDVDANGNPLGFYKAISKTGSTQQLLDYLPYLKTIPGLNPSFLKPGQLKIGKASSDGTGIYYGLDLGETMVNGESVPLLHITAIDTVMLLTDAGYYDWNFKAPKIADNFRFDPTDPSPQSGGELRPDGMPADAPSLSYQMFAWAKQDLQQSKAVWSIVAGHHAAYTSGKTTAVANDTYFNNPGIVKFLAGLKDADGKPLLDAYFNGHNHAYSRVLETAQSPGGVGTGIPFLTMGNGGKVPDPFNQAPYGTSVLEPENFSNTFTIGGQPYTNANRNFFDQNPDTNYQAYLATLPKDAKPTSVGLSSFYSYTKNNYPNDYVAKDDNANPGQFIIKVPEPYATEADTTREFKVSASAYETLLSGDPATTRDISGLYGYGSGAAYMEADQGYLFTHYKTAEVLDPALVLLGRQLGLADSAMNRGSLFYEQWSPQTARPEDLAMFSFDVIVNADQSDASIDHLQLVQQGQGYLEQAIGSTTYLDGTYTFEILGNNPIQPLGFDQLDPSRAAVELSFSDGKLQGLRFARDGQGNERRGSGYLQLANAINGNNLNLSTKRGDSLLVGININLEAQYTFADQAPGSDLYQDWYLMADTDISSTSIAQGSYGGLQLRLQPSAQRARDLLASQPITTGYSGSGPQASYATPQQGVISIHDAAGNLISGDSQTPLRLNQGSTRLLLNQLPAPGALQVDFAGDATSSYLVNYRPASSSLSLRYGSWEAGLTPGPDASLLLGRDLPITIVRSDSLQGSVCFGLRQAASPTPLWILQNANGASGSALDTTRLFTASGSGSWLSSEGQRQGDRAASTGSLSAGSWIPVARDGNGQDLAVQAITVSGNSSVVQFSGGIQARYGTASTGRLASPDSASPLVVNIKRLGAQNNGLAFYRADPVTGAILLNGSTLLPGDPAYLQGALALAKNDNLLISANQMPAYGSETTLTSLPLDPQQNYGLLLLRNNDANDLSSSFAAANPGGIVTMQTFAAPDRGIVYGIEDLKPSFADFDYNDVIVTVSTSSFQLV